MPDRERGAGAWSYFGDPRAISHDGHTFTGWISTTGNVWVARYTKGGKLSKKLIFRGLGRDDHNNPSLVFRRDGHIMVFFSPHSGHHLPPPGIPKTWSIPACSRTRTTASGTETSCWSSLCAAIVPPSQVCFVRNAIRSRSGHRCEVRARV